MPGVRVEENVRANAMTSQLALMDSHTKDCSAKANVIRRRVRAFYAGARALSL